MSIHISNTKVRIDGESRFVLRDGTQQEGRILVSDAEGNATWKSGRGLVGQDRYIGERYGGGIVVGIWKESGEEKVLIASPSGAMEIFIQGFGGEAYNFNTPYTQWGQTTTGTMSFFKYGCYSPGDGAFNTYKAYEFVKSYGWSQFYGIAQFYNFPKVFNDHGQGGGFFVFPGPKFLGYDDWYVPSIQEMKMVMDNAFILQRSSTEGYIMNLDPKSGGWNDNRYTYWTSTEPDEWDEGTRSTYYAYAYDTRRDKFVLRLKSELAQIWLVRTEVTKSWLKHSDFQSATYSGYAEFQQVLNLKYTPFKARVTMCLDATDKLSYNDSTLPTKWTDLMTYGLTSSRSFDLLPVFDENSPRFSPNFGGYITFNRGGLGNGGDKVSGSIFGLRTTYTSTEGTLRTEHISMEFWFRPTKPLDAVGDAWSYWLVSFPSANREIQYYNPGVWLAFTTTAKIIVTTTTDASMQYEISRNLVLDKWNHVVISTPIMNQTIDVGTTLWHNGVKMTGVFVNGFYGNASFDLGFGYSQKIADLYLNQCYGPRIGDFVLGANQEIQQINWFTGFDQGAPAYQPGSFYRGDISLFRTFDRILTKDDALTLYNDKKNLYFGIPDGTHAIDQRSGPGTFSVVQPLQLVLPGRKNLKVLRATENGTASWVEKNYLFYKPDNRREIGDYYGGGIIVNISNYPANVYNYTIMSIDDISGPYLGTFSFGKVSGATTSDKFLIDSYNLQSELTYYQAGGGNAPNQFYPYQFLGLYTSRYDSTIYDPINNAYRGLGYYPETPGSYDVPNNFLLNLPGYQNQRAIRYTPGQGTLISGFQYESGVTRTERRGTWQHRNVGYMWHMGSQVSTLANSWWNGVYNTDQIMKFSNPTWSAAAATRLFSVDQTKGSQGFTDWYLPAIAELEQAFKNLTAVSGKTRHSPRTNRRPNADQYKITHTPENLAGDYWSSTELSNIDAYYYRFGGYKSPMGDEFFSTATTATYSGINVGSKNLRKFVRAFRKVSVLANYKRWGEPSPNDEPALDWYVEPFDEKNWTPYPGLKKGAVFNVDTDRPPSYNGRFLGWSSVIYNRQNGVFGNPSTGTVLQGVTWSATEVALYFNGTWSAPGVTFKRDSYIEFNGPYNITVGASLVPARDIIEVWCKPTHEVSSITTARGIVCTHGFSVDSSNPNYFDRVYAGYNLALTQNDGSDTYGVIVEHGNNLGGGAGQRRSLNSASRPVIKDRWNHIVAEFVNFNKTVAAVLLWVNGKKVAQTVFQYPGTGDVVSSSSGFSMSGFATTVENNGSGRVLIGCLWVGAKYVFEGWIGKVKTYAAPPYTSGITDAEVNNNYQKDRVRYNAPSPITYLVAQSGLRLHLDASSYVGGGIWNDMSGRFNQSSGLESRVNAPVVPTFVSVTKSAGYFTMASNYFVVPGNSALANFDSGITIIVIADFGAADAAERLVDFGNGQGFDNIIFSRVGNSNNLVYQVFNGSQTLLLSTPLVNGVIPNQWGFYGVRSSSTQTKLFNQFTSVTYNTSDLPANVIRNSSFIGKSNWVGDANFSGRLAVVAVWNRPLTDREIDDFYRHYKDRYNFNYTGA